jgi:ATP-dependent phosphoenolpyruvate carboxykinase
VSKGTHEQKLRRMLDAYGSISDNPRRQTMIGEALADREAIAAANGALATWTPIESAGRQPKDTYMVRDEETETTVDWGSRCNIPMAPTPSTCCGTMRSRL